MRCDKHNKHMECMAGHNAHRSNWYCTECDKEQRINVLEAARDKLRSQLSEANGRETELAGLVEAAAAYVEKYLSNPGTEIACNLKSATNACLPRSSPADRLEDYKNRYVSQPSIASKILDNIIAELRDGEGA